MIKTLIPAAIIAAVLTSCSSLRPAINGGTNSTASTPVEVKSQTNKEVKFLDDISVTAQTPPSNNQQVAVKKEPTAKAALPAAKPGNTKKNTNPKPVVEAPNEVHVPKASDLELKYAGLLNVDAELLLNDPLLEHIDEWYGTKYRYGGTTKKGIDCSAFVQTIYLSAFGVLLPRTARDQYRSSTIISGTQLKEGDLVFFNTRGGVSHVGIYLQNNKFVHASTSNGVTISDMYDSYYLKRFIGAGRIEKAEASVPKGDNSNN